VIAELRVRDLATIEDVALQLGPGLNVLTGETGAGKSLLVDAVALLLGARGDSGAVRPGAARALLEGAFEPVHALVPLLDELGLEAEDNRLVIRREVSAEGRSRAWVNGSPTTIAALGRLGEALVDLHGQHETQSLLRADAQRDILDAFAGAAPERSQVAARYREVMALSEQERTLAARRDEVRRRADYLRHLVAEIEGARLVAGEEEQLEVEARRLRHAGALVEHAQRVVELLDGDEASALRALRDADRAVTALERIDPDVAAWREMLDAAFANLTELARAAGDYAASVSQDPARQETVERRRDQPYGERERDFCWPPGPRRRRSWSCWIPPTWISVPLPGGARRRPPSCEGRRRRSPPSDRRGPADWGGRSIACCRSWGCREASWRWRSPRLPNLPAPVARASTFSSGSIREWSRSRWRARRQAVNSPG